MGGRAGDRLSRTAGAAKATGRAAAGRSGGDGEIADSPATLPAQRRRAAVFAAQRGRTAESVRRVERGRVVASKTGNEDTESLQLATRASGIQRQTTSPT